MAQENFMPSYNVFMRTRAERCRRIMEQTADLYVAEIYQRLADLMEQEAVSWERRPSPP